METLDDVTGDGGEATANGGAPAPPAEPAAPPAPGEHHGTELDRLRDRVARHEAAIETLRDTTKKKRPWYLDAGPLISTVALLLSFSTTYYACRQAEAQKIHDARVELRGLLQRLSELPRQAAALPEQYDDPLVIGQIAGFIQQENKLLALHAAELMAQLDAVDPGHVTTSDYILVATAMFYSALIPEGIAILDQAEREIRDAQDGATIYRTRANVRFQMGDVQEGRADYLRALAVFRRFPTSSAFVVASTHALTEGHWAAAELGVRECQEAEAHLRRAFAHLAPHVSTGAASPLLGQLRQIEALLTTCGSEEQLEQELGMVLGPLIGPLVDRWRPQAGGGQTGGGQTGGPK